MPAPAVRQSPPRVWVDCDDLFGHFDAWSTPTGICRVQMEIIPQLMALAPGRIVLCRLGRTARELRIVQPEQLDRLRLRSGGEPGPAAGTIARTLRLAGLRIASGAHRFAMRVGLTRPTRVPEQGDWLLAMGGTWSNPGFGRAVAGLKAAYAMRMAHLVHDLLPQTHPELVAGRHVERFARWIRVVALQADHCLTPSRYVATELSACLAGTGWPDTPVTPVMFGSGFSLPADKSTDPELPGTYVLFVSTIEIRKNHLFIARVWQKLLARHGPDRVPTLVLVGRFGWKTQPFADFLRDTRNLDGKIVVRSNLSDGDLDRAYARCLFTVFPSLLEGCGLPVAESLAHGKVCVAADTTSIPEVGGQAADYFDPANEESALSAIERVLFQPGYREAREDWIRGNYRPRSWGDAATTILEALSSATIDLGPGRPDADR